MIQRSEQACSRQMRESMICSRSRIQSYERKSIHGCAGNSPRVSVASGGYDDNRGSDQACNESGAVRYRIGDLLSVAYARVVRDLRDAPADASHFVSTLHQGRPYSDMNKSNRTLAIALILGAVALGAAGSAVFGKMIKIPDKTAVAPSGQVMDSAGIADWLHARCGALAGDAKTSCLSKPLDSLAALGQVRTAMGALNRLAALDADIRRDGHVFAHGIGIAGGKRGGDIAATFAMCDPSNQSGCYHGVIQAYFAAAKQVGPEQVKSLCEPFRGPNADRWIRFQCVHGMGHGLEAIYNHNLPKVLTVCDYLDDQWDRLSCYGGAFMENIVKVTTPTHPAHDMASHGGAHTEGMDHDMPAFKAVDPADPLYPCSIVGERYQVSCYEMQTSVILYLNKGNIGAAARTCDTAPPRMRYICYQSLGRDISSYAMQDHKKSREMCMLGTSRYQPWCFFGLVKNFVDLNAKAADGFAFCKTLDGDSNKMKCYEAVGEQIGTLRNDAEGRRAMCADAEAAFRDACYFGARVSPTAPELLAKLNASQAGS